MESFRRILSDLNIRLCEGYPSESIDRAPSAIFQIIARDTSNFHLQIPLNTPFRFDAFYKHKDQFYHHPYTLRTQINPPIHPTSAMQYNPLIEYEISLYLELKRLERFDRNDLKRYYQVIDQNIDNDEEFQDFHEIYLVFQYEINGQVIQFSCNDDRPIHLPTFISNPWTQINTLTRFRYDAENRDGMFPCEMTLRHGNRSHLRSYKVVLCLVSNTIPARIDCHALRWLCRFRLEATNIKTSSKRQVEKEKLYNLNHSTGLVIAEVFGPNQTFNPQMLNSNRNLNYVKSHFEPEDFRTKLNDSMNNVTSTLAIAVIKTSDYLFHMKTRRTDPYLRRYLPFHEMGNIDENLDLADEKIIKRLKDQKEQRNQQLILDDSNDYGTFSQAHVRLYVAAYDENDILLTETLHPPLRNSKTFEQLHIIRIVQPKHELHAHESAYVYCTYDYHKTRLNEDMCPYEFQLVFTHSTDRPTAEQLLQLFRQPNTSVPASFVPNCTYLLQFQVPNDPKYDKHRIFLRLRHRQSKDYNPSDIALCDNVCWTYHADLTAVTDLMLENESSNAPKSNPPTPTQTIELQLHSLNQYSILSESDDSNHSIRPLHTPELEPIVQKRFSFSHLTSTQDDGMEFP